MQVCFQDSALLGNILIYSAQQLWTQFTSKTVGIFLLGKLLIMLINDYELLMISIRSKVTFQ